LTVLIAVTYAPEVTDSYLPDALNETHEEGPWAASIPRAAG